MFILPETWDCASFESWSDSGVIYPEDSNELVYNNLDPHWSDLVFLKFFLFFSCKVTLIKKRNQKSVKRANTSALTDRARATVWPSLTLLVSTDELIDDELSEIWDTEDTLLKLQRWPWLSVSFGNGDWAGEGKGGLSSSRSVDVSRGRVDKGEWGSEERCCSIVLIWKQIEDWRRQKVMRNNVKKKYGNSFCG